MAKPALSPQSAQGLTSASGAVLALGFINSTYPSILPTLGPWEPIVIGGVVAGAHVLASLLKERKLSAAAVEKAIEDAAQEIEQQSAPAPSESFIPAAVAQQVATSVAAEPVTPVPVAAPAPAPVIEQPAQPVVAQPVA